MRLSEIAIIVTMKENSRSLGGGDTGSEVAGAHHWLCLPAMDSRKELKGMAALMQGVIHAPTAGLSHTQTPN